MKAKLRTKDPIVCFNEIYIKNELVNVISTIDSFKELISNKDIEFDEYINIINSIYDVELSNYDILKICNDIFKVPCKTTILNTNLQGVIINQIEKNNKFEYIEEQYPLDINIAFTNDIDIDVYHTYNISEITKLIKERKIILLDFIINGNSYYDYEEYNLYPLNNITYEGLLSIERIDKDYIPSVRKTLNNYFTTDKLKQDLNEYITEVKDKLTYLDKYIDDTKTSYKQKLKEYDKVSSMSKRIQKINKDS